MKTPFRALHLCLAASLCLVAGCYDRLTSNFSDIRELDASAGSMVEVSKFIANERRARLRKITSEAQKNERPYTINSGDVIAITVYNHPDLSLGKTIVTTDGCIGMVLVGQLKISGMTLEQASAAIEKELEKYVRNPKVGISPLEIKSETATISGAVTKPGMYTIAQGMRLADLLAIAGGVSNRLYDGMVLDAADFSKSVFVRDGEQLPVDFSLAIEQGDPVNNVLLHKGDYVYLATRDNSMVYLLGDVKAPQRRVLIPNMGLVELISACGGLNDNHWTYAIILRGGANSPKLYKVDLDGVLQGRKPNVLLESGDVVYVPHDNISEYNVFLHKLFPTFQLFNMISTPMFWYTKF